MQKVARYVQWVLKSCWYHSRQHLHHSYFKSVFPFVPVTELALPRQNTSPVKSSPHLQGPLSHRVICAMSNMADHICLLAVARHRWCGCKKRGRSPQKWPSQSPGAAEARSSSRLDQAEVTAGLRSSRLTAGFSIVISDLRPGVIQLRQCSLLRQSAP